MILSTMIDGEIQNSINSSIPISLLDSEFFGQYIEHLIELEVTSIVVTISGYDNGVTNSEIKLGNTILENNIDDSVTSINIVNSYKLEDVSQELLNSHSIPFTFSGDSISVDTFQVSVTITFKGVFIN